MDQGLRVGELAARTGVGRKALRLYEGTRDSPGRSPHTSRIPTVPARDLESAGVRRPGASTRADALGDRAYRRAQAGGLRTLHPRARAPGAEGGRPGTPAGRAAEHPEDLARRQWARGGRLPTHRSERG